MKPPVFVVGTPRSGTTLLYHMLLSAGGFAVLRAETHAFSIIGPRFRDFRNPARKRRLLDVWLRSRVFRLSQLEPEYIENRLFHDCNNVGDFLRMVMESIATSQGVDRWAECTPDHLIYMRQILTDIPNAIFIHIIRDGRDVALSWNKTGWIRPLPWDAGKSLLVTGLRWRWMVQRGREIGRDMGDRYLEVRFEELVLKPQEALTRIGAFIHHDLDFRRMRERAIGSLGTPNTSFEHEKREHSFSPIGRWKTHLTDREITRLESAIGDLIEELGYELSAPASRMADSTSIRGMRLIYGGLYSLKHWVKIQVPLSRHLINLDLLAE